MKPRAVAMLERLIARADQMVRDQDARKLRSSAEVSIELHQIAGELGALLSEPAENGHAGFDETATMLADCLVHLNNRGGPLGDSEHATRWAALAKCFLPMVRTDWAVAIGAAHLPDAPDYISRKA